MTVEDFLSHGEYAAAGAFEEPERSLFYRKALGIRRFYENCPLCPYTGKKLYPSGAFSPGMAIAPGYMSGLQVCPACYNEGKKEAVAAYDSVFSGYSSKVPPEHTLAGNMWCHSMPNYGRIVREGLCSYAERAGKNTDRDFREGLLHIYEGIKCYIFRCVAYLETEGAEPALIAALRKVPLEKADTLYEAVVAWNFILYLDSCDNLGCLAGELYGFYRGEDITPLLENLFDNLDRNDGFSMALHTGYNGLTLQCLAAAKGKRRPMIELFVDRDTPKEVWDAAFALMRSKGGQPAFYSPRLLSCLQTGLPIAKEDIGNFCGGGCTESMIAGCSNIGSIDAGINLLLVFEKALYAHLPFAKSFDAFYKCYLAEVRKTVDEVTEKIVLSQKERAALNPLPMRTFLVDDCVDRGVDFNAGGARYNWSIVNFGGLINVIDALLTVRDMLFAEKEMEVSAFLGKLKNNDSAFLDRCRKNRHTYGVDDTYVNEFSRKLSAEIFAMLDGRKTFYGAGFIPASIQFVSQAEGGRRVGATPDGRHAGEPLCDSLGAIFGKDRKGPTALLKSVTALCLEKALGTPVLNFNIDENWSDDILKSLILSYIESGGLQMQITFTSAEELRAAYRNPELHRNLVVRVGGYSEYFYRLPNEVRRMVVNRTVQKEGDR